MLNGRQQMHYHHDISTTLKVMHHEVIAAMETDMEFFHMLMRRQRVSQYTISAISYEGRFHTADQDIANTLAWYYQYLSTPARENPEHDSTFLDEAT